MVFEYNAAVSFHNPKTIFQPALKLHYCGLF